MAYYRRSAWTSTANQAVSVKRSQVHATLHYPGFGSSSIRTGSWSRERCFQQLRAWRNMHVGSGAYREVAYNLYALPTGDVAEGRGNRQNGANGKSTANRAGMSVQVLIGDNEPLTEGHLKAIFAAFALLESWHPGITRRQYGHSHWVSTACPGRHVRAGIPYRAGSAPSPGTSAPVPKPPVKADPARQWRTSPRVKGMSATEVKRIQRLLVDEGYSVGSYGIDGSYGDSTGSAVRSLQQDLELTADGIYGPGTEAEVASIKAIVTENQKRIERSIAIGTENQKRIGAAREELDWVRRVVEANQRRIDRNERRVSHISRNGEEISLRQEVADAKTLAMANAAQIKSISALLSEANVDATEAKVPDKAEG